MNNAENWTSKYPHRKLNIDTEFRNMIEVEQEYLDTAKKLIKITNYSISNKQKGK